MKSSRADVRHRDRKLLLSPLMRALKEVFAKAPRWKPARHSHPGRWAAPAAKPFRFEALEPRVLLAGDTNPAAVNVTGSIDVPGETDQYGFTLAQNAQILFDSTTSNGNLNWSLSGPLGTIVANRSFSGSDSADIGATSPALGL